MVIIPIDPLTRIKGTERAWELQKVRTRNGQPTWEPYKWFTTFRSALDEAVHREIRLHPAEGIAEAIEAVSEVAQRFSILIPDEYNLQPTEKSNGR